MKLKLWLQDFPTHQATVFVALCAIALLSLIVDIRLALGLVFPDGYDTYVWMLASLLGVTGAWGVGKRLTDYNYAAIAAGKSPSAVTAEAGSNVNVSAPAKATPSTPDGA